MWSIPVEQVRQLQYSFGSVDFKSPTIQRCKVAGITKTHYEGAEEAVRYWLVDDDGGSFSFNEDSMMYFDNRLSAELWVEGIRALVVLASNKLEVFKL
jgi:hypothetical protein